MSIFLGAVKDLTSNQYYKGLNNRFDNRSTKLRRAKYKFSKEYNGWYQGSNPDNEKKMGRMISSSVVMYAENRAFNDLFLRRFNKGNSFKNL
jgi:hypothetical protein